MTDEAVIDLIKNTADSMGNVKDFGSGRPNAYKALHALRLTGVSMSGPSCLEPQEAGTYTAQVQGGYYPLRYEWWYFSPCTSSLENGTPALGPDCGSWVPYGGNQASIVVSNTQDFRIYAKVTDGLGTTITTSTRFVEIDPYNGCGAVKNLDVTSSSQPDLPSAFLAPNHPNPFNPSTEIMLMVDQTQEVTVEVFDLLGRRVALLHEGRVTAGEPLRMVFEAHQLPSGIYFYSARGEHFVATRRMTLLK